MKKKEKNRELPAPDISQKWVSCNTAILVIHGIGHQNPIETIDQFGRTLLETYSKVGQVQLTVSHELAKKQKSDGQNFWFDNFLRIKPEDKKTEFCLDLFEYYWANKTENAASFSDILDWSTSVAKGARKFYHKREEAGIRYKDKSFFFTGDGRFRFARYHLTLYLLTVIGPLLGSIFKAVINSINYVLGGGLFFSGLAKNLSNNSLSNLSNVIGDIVVYNSTDRKSKFYDIRKEILNGAVNALKFLVENDQAGKRRYDRVILVGHSLGSQIAYDAINRLVHLTNFNQVSGWGFNGNSLSDNKELKDVFFGFMTMGSPLDKIAFFLRENVPEKQYLRSQVLNNFHAFKYLRDNTQTQPVVHPPFRPILDEIKWINFWDKRDWVSGSLEYYANVKNQECFFTNSWFTHSSYWDSQLLFQNLIHEYLIAKK